MKAIYSLVGYDKQTDYAIRFHALADAVVPLAMEIAGLSPEIAALYHDWPLTDEMVQRMEPLAGMALDTEQLSWCLEPNAVAEGRKAATVSAIFSV
jgi:hypothetical protein